MLAFASACAAVAEHGASARAEPNRFVQIQASDFSLFTLFLFEYICIYTCQVLGPSIQQEGGEQLLAPHGQHFVVATDLHGEEYMLQVGACAVENATMPDAVVDVCVVVGRCANRLD